MHLEAFGIKATIEHTEPLWMDPDWVSALASSAQAILFLFGFILTWILWKKQETTKAKAQCATKLLITARCVTAALRQSRQEEICSPVFIAEKAAEKIRSKQEKLDEALLEAIAFSIPTNYGRKLTDKASNRCNDLYLFGQTRNTTIHKASAPTRDELLSLVENDKFLTSLDHLEAKLDEVLIPVAQIKENLPLWLIPAFLFVVLLVVGVIRSTM